MHADDRIGVEERRGLERRLEMAEKELRELDKRTAVMMTKIEALISTMDSRDKAFSRGQDLILSKLERFVSPEVISAKFEALDKIIAQVASLDSAKSKFSGALWLALTLLGMAGGIVTLVKAIKGP